MEISISIAGVDGETGYSLFTRDLKTARNFLASNDHEGSSVTINITDHDELAYWLLKALEDAKK